MPDVKTPLSLDQLETPVVTVDIDRLEANIQRLQAYLDQHGIANRPHMKTHKIPAIAQQQITAGAVGITCQKLGEAEIMARASIQDIFLPYNFVGVGKLERLVELTRTCQVSVTADSPVIVQGLSQAMQLAGLTLSVLVECDTGMKRCGVQTPQEAVELAQTIARSPGLTFGGLMTYPSSPVANDFMIETNKLLTAKGLSATRISGGGTHVMWQAHTFTAFNEHRAGEYVFGDRRAIMLGAMQQSDCALTITTTVVSRPTADRGVIDAGSKTLTSDTMALPGHGLIVEYPDAIIAKLSEEHGHVDFSACARKPDIGERVTIIPNHVCVVTNLHDQLVGTRNGQVETIWDVACRGAIR